MIDTFRIYIQYTADPGNWHLVASTRDLERAEDILDNWKETESVSEARIDSCLEYWTRELTFSHA